MFRSFYSSVNGQKFGSVPFCYSVDAGKKEVSCPNKNRIREFRSSLCSVNGVLTSQINGHSSYPKSLKISYNIIKMTGEKHNQIELA